MNKLMRGDRECDSTSFLSHHSPHVSIFVAVPKLEMMWLIRIQNPEVKLISQRAMRRQHEDRACDVGWLTSCATHSSSVAVRSRTIHRHRWYCHPSVRSDINLTTTIRQSFSGNGKSKEVNRRRDRETHSAALWWVWWTINLARGSFAGRNFVLVNLMMKFKLTISAAARPVNFIILWTRRTLTHWLLHVVVTRREPQHWLGD